jgi:signal transduction histidine kinase/DNA-binding response OmpR family regulator
LLGGVWGSGLFPVEPWWIASCFAAGAVAVAVRFAAERRRDRGVPEASSVAAETTDQGISAAEVLEAVGAGAAQLTALLGEAGIALLVTDLAGAVLHASDTAAELLERGDDRRWAAQHPAGTFFGLPVDDSQHLASLHRFFSSDGDSGEGVATIAGSRRQLYWAGRVLRGTEGLGHGRLFVVRDVTAERRFEALKSDFLATVSHELRTPLTSLRGSLQLVLARTESLGAADRGLLEIGVGNAERLIRLINDLLDIDALEQGSLAFRFTTLDITDLIKPALDAIQGVLEEKEVRVQVDLAEELPIIHGDRERLVQVLLQLLSNAGKYAPFGSTVTIRTCANDSGVQVDVQDRGPGIPVAEQPHVFERFWRSERGGADAGAGLGLAICRAVISRHGGEIWLTSEEGQGATFSVFLPRSILRVDDRAARERRPVESARVLLVEDDPDARAVLRAALEGHGYAVVEAQTGAQGVTLARREQPAAVLLDVLLPDISGYDVLRILKNAPETAPTPVLVLSVEPERELARRLGAWDALMKPLDFEAVRWSLAQALQRVGQPDGCLVVAVGPALSRDLTVLASALDRDGHRVHRAADIDDLAEWATANYPDVLVLDDEFLPERTRAAEALCQSSNPGRIIVVLLSAADDEEEAPPGWVRLRKPVSKADVLQAVQRVATAPPW